MDDEYEWVQIIDGREVRTTWRSRGKPPCLGASFRVLEDEWREEDGQLMRVIRRAELVELTLG